MHVKSIGILIYNPDKKVYVVGKNIGFNVKGKKVFQGDTNLQNKYAVKGSPLIMEEIRDKEKESIETIRMLNKLGVEIIVPLTIKDEVVGIIALGSKESGDMYNSEDLQVLTIVGTQAAIAIENALLYKEAQDFNAKLRREIAKATKELRIANTELKQLDKVKSEFISIASHQLRTPLTSVKGFVSLLADGTFGKVSKPIRETLLKVFSSNERLIKLVDDLLDLSRIESGRINFEFAKNDVIKMVSDVIADHKMHAKNKNLYLKLNKPAKSIQPFIFDKDKLHEAVSNLVDNAIKYTAKGGITVSLENRNGIVRIVVADTGIGLTKGDIEKIFKKFQRGRESNKVNVSGLGIGLYIGQKMVLAHKGKILVESDGPGKGSRFIIALKKNFVPPKTEKK